MTIVGVKPQAKWQSTTSVQHGIQAAVMGDCHFLIKTLAVENAHLDISLVKTYLAYRELRSQVLY